MKIEFKKNLEVEVLPGLKLCEALRNKYDVLKKRNAASIKAWVNHTIRKSRKITQLGNV